MMKLTANQIQSICATLILGVSIEFSEMVGVVSDAFSTLALGAFFYFIFVYKDNTNRSFKYYYVLFLLLQMLPEWSEDRMHITSTYGVLQGYPSYWQHRIEFIDRTATQVRNTFALSNLLDCEGVGIVDLRIRT